ncbi:MAG: hypothetical protein U1A78_33740 [Polyangia bacterium]
MQNIVERLEVIRRSVEGDPFWGAVLGGGIALILEGGRLVALQGEESDQKLKALEQKVKGLESTPAVTAPVNLHRLVGKAPAIGTIAASITGGQGSVGFAATTTATDQSGRVRIVAGSQATSSGATVAHFTFATAYKEAPGVFIFQQSGTDVAFRIANVTASGFDLITGTGLTANNVYELAYLVVPLSTLESLS